MNIAPARVLAAIRRDQSWSSSVLAVSAKPLEVPQNVVGALTGLDAATGEARATIARLRKTMADAEAGRIDIDPSEESASFAEVWHSGRRLRAMWAERRATLRDFSETVARLYPEHERGVRRAAAVMLQSSEELIGLIEQINEILREGYVRIEAPNLARANAEALHFLAR